MRNRIRGGALALAFVALGVTACVEDAGTPPIEAAGTPPELGDHIDGLTPEEEAAFERGKLLFTKRFKPSEGLGPLYNSTSCVSCHSSPVPGGSSQLYRNFYICLIGNPGSQVPLADVPSPVVPAYGKGPHLLATFGLEDGRTVMPDPAAFPGTRITIAQRNSLPIFGVGLFEFISDGTILAGADPDDADGDGISGRYNTDQGAIGRFGVKAQSNNIELFTRAPLQNQMGITTDPFLGAGGIVSLGPLQASTDPNDPTTDNDGVPDPELATTDLGDLIAFSRFLAPPAKKPFDAAATNGEQLFDQIGCTKCHVPSLPSSRGPVDAYTDLLLHDMGPVLADGLNFGVPQPSAISPMTSDQEFRTQPLWGVTLSQPYLHDGRAETLTDAITLHGGEAQAIRDAFVALTPAEQADILSFLEKL
jgi:CxxC motif-containing protein (DUF1111 family)